MTDCDNIHGFITKFEGEMKEHDIIQTYNTRLKGKKTKEAREYKENIDTYHILKTIPQSCQLTKKQYHGLQTAIQSWESEINKYKDNIGIIGTFFAKRYINKTKKSIEQQYIK